MKIIKVRKEKPEPLEDWMSEKSARNLARSIVAYWRQRKNGRNVNVWLEEVDIKGRAHFFVRSNLVNGMPPMSAPLRKAA